jgi:hypothetical protein
MRSTPPGALEAVRRASTAALRRAALWFAGGFTASALLVILTAMLASALTDGQVALRAPALLVALALGLAVGWATALVALTVETLRRLEASVEAELARRHHP